MWLWYYCCVGTYKMLQINNNIISTLHYHTTTTSARHRQTTERGCVDNIINFRLFCFDHLFHHQIGSTLALDIVVILTRIGMLLLLWRMRSWNLLLKFRFGWIGGIWIVFTINFVWLKITVELRGRVIRNRCERSRWSHIKIAIAYITSCSMGGGRIFWVVGCSQRSVACQIFGGEIPIVNRKLVNN